METEIRTATPADADALVALGRRLHVESARYRRLRFDEDRARAVFGSVVGNGGAFVAVKGGTLVGMLLGFVVAPFFTSDLTAGEFTVYIAPEHRGGTLIVRMVRAFEQWATAQGVKEITLGVSTEINTERVARLYEQLGYRRSAVALVKEVSA